MNKLQTFCESIVKSIDSIKEDLTSIEEMHKIKGKVYQSIRVESKNIRDTAQEIRKEILKKFKEQQKK